VIEADRVVPVPAAGVSREGIVPQLAPTLAPTRAPVEIDNVFENCRDGGIRTRGLLLPISSTQSPDVAPSRPMWR
jgi:hypothetical protein